MQTSFNKFLKTNNKLYTENVVISKDVVDNFKVEGYFSMGIYITRHISGNIHNIYYDEY